MTRWFFFFYLSLLLLTLWWGGGWFDHPRSIFNKVRFHGKTRSDGITPSSKRVELPRRLDHIRNDLMNRIRMRDEDLMDPDEGVPYLIRRSSADLRCGAIVAELRTFHVAIRIELIETNEKFCSVLATYREHRENRENRESL